MSVMTSGLAVIEKEISACCKKWVVKLISRSVQLTLLLLTVTGSVVHEFARFCRMLTFPWQSAYWVGHSRSLLESPMAISGAGLGDFQPQI